MLAIPLPFVVSLLLSVLAGNLWAQRANEAKMACYFLLLCALTTAIVGLRWTFDLALFRLLQPIVASVIPVAAWYVFNCAADKGRLPWWHWVIPAFIALGSLGYPLWPAPLDLILTGLYVAYGIALVRASYKSGHLPVNVRINALGKALQAERLAGGMLLFSAVIDGAMTIDFAFFEGQHAEIILTLGHAMLLPALALSVVFMSLSTATEDEELERAEPPEKFSKQAPEQSAFEPAANYSSERGESLADDEVEHIIGKVEVVLKEQALYLDPDLTLAKIARKTGTPARQVSFAINETFGRNISRVVNEYRIAHAKNLLESTDAAITQVYLNSGFQTKSNFHREFSRVTSMTPSAYRRNTKQGSE